jgi:signal transduction histidine kinase
LRLKFFFIIFSVLCITAVSISAIYFHYFRLERLRLIELNLQQNATLLTNSDLTLTKSEFSRQGKQFIDRIIGDDKVNIIIAIYSMGGNILYKNDNAAIFDLENKLPAEVPTWQDVETKDYFIKFLTVRDESQRRIVKVGMILNQSLLRWRYLNQRIFIYIGVVLFVITIISFFLTHILFRPVHQLAEQVNLMSEKVEKGEFSDLKSWFALIQSKNQSNDEFNNLINSLDKLANKIIENQSLTQKWSALMAHELKTPMTILKNSIDNLTKNSTDTEKVKAVDDELERLEEIIMNFLEWASLENDPSRPDIHVIMLGKRCQSLVQTMQGNYSKADIRFNNKLAEEKKIFCHPLHFDQVINNLIVNSIKYGQGKDIIVELEQDYIIVKDSGPGIPESVIENFGKPFNKFKQGDASGHGLGLAWVNTIAKKYDWKISLDNSSGTIVKIFIPNSIES